MINAIYVLPFIRLEWREEHQRTGVWSNSNSIITVAIKRIVSTNRPFRRYRYTTVPRVLSTAITTELLSFRTNFANSCRNVHCGEAFAENVMVQHVGSTPRPCSPTLGLLKLTRNTTL